jgi:hypothetical protein
LPSISRSSCGKTASVAGDADPPALALPYQANAAVAGFGPPATSNNTATFAASGWYDLTITVSDDSSWSQRFTGHLENGPTSITG